MQPLYAFKHGEVQQGRWSWAVGADSRVHGSTRPYVLATTNFHGCIAAGHDPEKLAPMMAAAPAMLAALQSACDQMEQCESMFRDDAEFIAALEETRAAIAAATGALTGSSGVAAPIVAIRAGEYQLEARADCEGFTLTDKTGPTPCRHHISADKLESVLEALAFDPAATGER